MAYIFQEILSRAPNRVIERQKGVEAREWFRRTASRVASVNPDKMLDTAEPFTIFESLSINSIGKMYCFLYDAKHKDTLPYWDKFPLIFPVNFYSDGFLGLNLHYLPRVHRAMLMNQLYQTANNDKMDKTTKLKISYEMLSKAARFKLFEPCIKRYLFSQVESKFMLIRPQNWDMALMLPSEQFVGATRQKVHSDSLRKVRNS